MVGGAISFTDMYFPQSFNQTFKFNSPSRVAEKLYKTSLMCFWQHERKKYTRAWSFRMHYGTANQRSFRFVFCQISFPPLPSLLPSPYFLFELPKRDLGTRSGTDSNIAHVHFVFLQQWYFLVIYFTTIDSNLVCSTRTHTHIPIHEI